MSGFDVVPRSDPAVISVPPTIYIHLVYLTQEVHRLTLHCVNILQLLHYVDVPSWQNNPKPNQVCICHIHNHTYECTELLTDHTELFV